MSRPIGSVYGSKVRNPVSHQHLRDFACECQAKRRVCRERVYMNQGTYRVESRLGRVVALAHVEPRDRVLARTRTYAVVAFVGDEALV